MVPAPFISRLAPKRYTRRISLPRVTLTMLLPTTPSQTVRYDNKRSVYPPSLSGILLTTHKVCLAVLIIQIPSKLARFCPCLCLSMPCIIVPSCIILSNASISTAEAPEGWACFDHPEGNIYFSHTGTPRVVTDDDILSPELSGLIALWASVARERAKTIGVTLSASSELYLHLSGSDDCFYYFVDHAVQVVFWVESVPIEDMNFELSTASASHLRSDLPPFALYASPWEELLTRFLFMHRVGAQRTILVACRTISLP